MFANSRKTFISLAIKTGPTVAEGMHTHEQSMNHTSLNKNAGLDVMQSHPLCRIRFDQY